jgi:hypothetical protein
MNDAQRKEEPFKLRSSSKPIEIIKMPGWGDFYHNFVKPNRPAIIEGMFDEWSARKKWTPDYFNNLMEVEGESDEEIRKGNINKEVLQYWICQDITGNRHLVAIKDDYKFPYKEIIPGAQRLWYGPPSASLGNTHYDLHHNFISNFFGLKHVVLFPHEAARALGSGPWYSPFHSQVAKQLFKNESDRFELPESVSSYEHTLVPGQALFLPSTWWHHIRTVSTSITLTLFWDIPRIFPRSRFPGPQLKMYPNYLFEKYGWQR